MQLTAKIALVVGLFFLSLALSVEAGIIVSTDSSGTQPEEQSLGFPEVHLFNNNNSQDKSVLLLTTSEGDSSIVISRQANNAGFGNI